MRAMGFTRFTSRRRRARRRSRDRGVVLSVMWRGSRRQSSVVSSEEPEEPGERCVERALCRASVAPSERCAERALCRARNLRSLRRAAGGATRDAGKWRGSVAGVSGGGVTGGCPGECPGESPGGISSRGLMPEHVDLLMRHRPHVCTCSLRDGHGGERRRLCLWAADP